jgi:hypothetical protein
LTASRPKTNLEPSVVKFSRLTTAPPSQEMTALGQPSGANQERSVFAYRMKTAKITWMRTPIPTRRQLMRRRLLEKRMAMPRIRNRPKIPLSNEIAFIGHLLLRIGFEKTIIATGL